MHVWAAGGPGVDVRGRSLAGGWPSLAGSWPEDCRPEPYGDFHAGLEKKSCGVPPVACVRCACGVPVASLSLPCLFAPSP